PGSSFSTCCHSKLFLLPKASKLSRYWRAVSKRLRVTSATTSLPLILNVAVSIAKGELYFLISSVRMRPEPWQTTLSASAICFLAEEGDASVAPTAEDGDASVRPTGA